MSARNLFVKNLQFPSYLGKTLKDIFNARVYMYKVPVV